MIIQHYKLHQFQFNGGSDLNRMDKSRWDQNSSCASTKSAQSDNLYFIQWTLLAQCKDNKAVSMLGESEKLETLRLETLFDDHRGPSYFWIPCALLPANYDGANEYLLTVAIVHNNNVKGIINGFIDEWNADDSLDASHPGVRMCEINQRCMAFEDLAINSYDGNIHKLCIPIDDNVIEIHRIGGCLTSFDSTLSHQIQCWRMDMDAVSQYDNKGRNLVSGIAQSTAKYFCALCDANSDSLHQLPRPRTMQFTTRTAQSKQLNLHNGLKSGSEVNLIQSKGVQNQPIYDIWAHRHGGVTLHNMEGIWAVGMDTYQDFLCPMHGHKQQWNTLQAHSKLMDDKYNQITCLRDHINATDANTTDRDVRKWLHESKTELTGLEAQYDQLEQEWQQMNDTIKSNELLQKFQEILKKHTISLYYMLPGSIQGAVCGKLCKAVPELVDLAFECNQTGAYIWAHYFNNLSYIYDMLKHKSARKWTQHEMASIKTAYIDWYHLHVICVSLWRFKGSTGVKFHYVVHDIEKSISNACSPAAEDDQRFENANQIVDSGVKNYTRYKKGDKLHLIARKSNTRTLHKPQR